MQMLDYFDKLNDWIKSNNYCGWDPYDGLNSNLTQKISNNKFILEVLIIQINKYSPINLRPILQIKKGIDLKGIALLSQAYSKLYRITHKNKYKDNLIFCLDYIINHSLIDKYGSNCWASHYFPYTSVSGSKLLNNKPDIIGTSESINALIDGYEILNTKKYLNEALDASYFIMDKFIQKKDNVCYSKYVIDQSNEKIVYNVSGKTLQLLSKIYKINNDKEIYEICDKLSNFLIKTQNIDGSWYYGKNKNTIYIQHDFHQGFIIDGLLEFSYHAIYTHLLINTIKKATFFYKNLFTKEGRSYFRYPFKYPTDIHNQAQGIITFLKLIKMDERYFEFAKKILFWTHKNMRDPSGYFYFQKWPIIINKIPYMRWSQAWMCLALATFLDIVKK